LQELKFIKQREGESVENYASRFKEILKIANRNVNVSDVITLEYFIDGLRSELVEQTRLGNIATLNDAIERAKTVERVRNERIYHEVFQKINEKEVAETLKEYSNQYKNKDDGIYNKMQEVKDTKKLEDMFKRLEIKLLSKMKNKNNNQRNNIRNLICYECGEKGHTAKVCQQRTNRNFRNQRNRNNMGRNEQRNVNYLEAYYDNEYDDEEYDYEGEIYNTDIPTGKKKREEKESYRSNVQNIKVKPRKKLSDETKWKMQMNRQASNKCSNCNQVGHYVKNCNSPPLKRQRLKVNLEDIENFAEHEFNSSTVELPRGDFIRLAGNKAVKEYKKAISNY
jgi:hypothetical protein